MSSDAVRTVRLASCATFQEGYVNPSQREPAYFGYDYKWLRATDLNDGFVVNTGRGLSEKGFASAGKSALLFEPNTLAISKSGTIGRVGILKDYMCGNRAVINIKVHPDCDTRFIFYTLLLKRSEIETLAEGSVQKNLYVSSLGRLEIVLPSLTVQRQVAETLGALDDRIALLRETNATLEAIAQALFKSWFVDFDPVRARQQGLAPEGMDEATAALFPDGFEESELGLVPKGWQSTTLAEVGFRHGGTIQTGPFGSQLHASDYVDSGVPVVMPKDIQYRRVMTGSIARVSSHDADRLGRHKLQRGDIVFSRRGDVERHALIGERETGWLCGTGCLLVRPGSRWPSPTFLSMTLDAPRARSWLVQHAVGATMPNLNTGILGSVPVLLPTVDVLQLFEEVISVTEEQRNHNASTMETLATLRDTLLPRLISGQLRLPGNAPEEFEVIAKPRACCVRTGT